MTRDDTTVTLFEWAGGMSAFERWTEEFYRRVPDDPLLAPLFAHMQPGHAKHVAHFIAEVCGGPSLYSAERGGHHSMVSKHVGKHLSEEQRKHWLQLLLECADAVGLPADPEFRSSLVGYLEWGTRLAVINSQLDKLPDTESHMPRWGWGETGGPYKG